MQLHAACPRRAGPPSPTAAVPPALHHTLDVQEERDQFKLQRFLMVVRAYSDPEEQQAAQQQADGGAGGSKGGKQQQQGKKKKKQRGEAAGSGVVHYLPEAECYQEAAEWSFTFPVADRLVGGGQWRGWRTLHVPHIGPHCGPPLELLRRPVGWRVRRAGSSPPDGCVFSLARLPCVCRWARTSCSRAAASCW